MDELYKVLTDNMPLSFENFSLGGRVEDSGMVADEYIQFDWHGRTFEIREVGKE